MNSHTMIAKTLSEHILMVIFEFFVKNVGFDQNYFHLSKLPIFYGNNSNGYRKHFPKIWAWLYYFSRFHRYWKFKIQRDRRVGGAEIFFLMNIYPTRLCLSKENTLDKETSVFDLNIKVIGSDFIQTLTTNKMTSNCLSSISLVEWWCSLTSIVRYFDFAVGYIC